MIEHNIGVDISKSHLDIFRLEDGATLRVENTAAGFKAMTKWLGRLAVARIVFEPTGAYHKAFEATLGVSFPLVKVNPLLARRFAQASGTRAKTDAVDARMLAKMGGGFWSFTANSLLQRVSHSQGFTRGSRIIGQGLHQDTQPS